MNSCPQIRQPRRSMLYVVVALALAMLASTVGLASAEALAEPQVHDSPAGVRPAANVEALRLACSADFIDGQRGVLCEWSEATDRRTRAYQLYRIIDGSPRELLTTVSADGRRGYFDTDLTAPAELVYGVISLNRNGRLIGRSEAVYVQFGDSVEQMRLSCRAASVDGERGVRCRWSKPDQPDARGYLVYRVVGDGEREVIAEIPFNERRLHFDTDISPGELHTYAVVTVDGSGNTVAQGGPKKVRWPAAG